jgi:hypothetical protein
LLIANVYNDLNSLQVRIEFVDALRSFRDKTANQSTDPTELAAMLTSELSILEVPNLDTVSNATVSAYHKLNADKIFKLYSSTRRTWHFNSFAVFRIIVHVI